MMDGWLGSQIARLRAILVAGLTECLIWRRWLAGGGWPWVGPGWFWCLHGQQIPDRWVFQQGWGGGVGHLTNNYVQSFVLLIACEKPVPHAKQNN